MRAGPGHEQHGGQGLVLGTALGIQPLSNGVRERRKEQREGMGTTSSVSQPLPSPLLPRVPRAGGALR